MSDRILIFSLAYYPKLVGGAEVAIKEITDRISSENTIFDMITLRFDSALPTEEKIGNVHIHRIGFSKEKPTAKELVRFPMYLLKVWYPIGAYIKARKLIKQYDYTIVWSMMSYMGFPALFIKSSFPKIKFILTLQEGDTIEHITKRLRIRLISFLYRAIFKKADIVQTISHYLALFARNMGYKGTIEVIPNGVDIKHFQNVNTEHVELLKKELGKKEEDIFLITTSRLVEKNAVSDIIIALQYLPVNIRLLVVGTGPLSDELKIKAQRLKLKERVMFLGHIPHEVVPYYLHASDIFIRPSLSEGMGNSFIEAMVTGVPVIATKVGGISDFLKDGETGLYCEVNNPRNIAQKIEKLIKDKESRDVIIKNAKQMVEEKYDWSLITESMKQKVFKIKK